MNTIIYLSSIQLFPIQTGGAQVVHQYAKLLASTNKVILITVKAKQLSSKQMLETTKNIIVLDILSANPIMKFLSPVTYFRIFQQILTQGPNKLVIEFPWFGTIGIISQYLLNIPFYIRCQNIEYRRMQRLQRWYWPILMVFELFVYKCATSIITISTQDKLDLHSELHIPLQKIHITEYTPDPKIFHPNKQSGAYIRKQLHLQNKYIVLFFGPLDYKPNIEAIEQIQTKIAPKVTKLNPNIVFLIVGRNPNMHSSNNGVIFTGYVEKIQDYINASDLIIVPLISGGGIRTKILEAVSCDKTVITTPLGCEGIHLDFKQKRIMLSPINRFSNVITSHYKTQL